MFSHYVFGLLSVLSLLGDLYRPFSGAIFNGYSPFEFSNWYWANKPLLSRNLIFLGDISSIDPSSYSTMPSVIQYCPPGCPPRNGEASTTSARCSHRWNIARFSSTTQGRYSEFVIVRVPSRLAIFPSYFTASIQHLHFLCGFGGIEFIGYIFPSRSLQVSHSFPSGTVCHFTLLTPES